MDNNINFITQHFAPIHTIPAPNLAIHDNHIGPEDLGFLQAEPKPQPYHSNQYQVTEDHTNDKTVLDPLSGKQTLFAPDPDPSLPTARIRPKTESFNTPSNGKPLPADVQSNHLPPAHPLVQIVGQQHSQDLLPEIYPIQFTSQTNLQPFISQHAGGIRTVPLAVYNPTYLVTQSNNLYTQHKQQLFKPNDNIIAAGYINADLTQEVASNGQILQAAKDPVNNIHPVLDAAPQFAALIATPPLHQPHQSLELETAPFHLTNAATQGGFVVSNFFSPDSTPSNYQQSQLLHAYSEEEAQHRQHENDVNNVAFQVQQHNTQLQQEQEQQLLLQQQENQQLELQQQQATNYQQPNAASSAYEEHQRLLQQHLGETPLRIFVPDDDVQSEV